MCRVCLDRWVHVDIRRSSRLGTIDGARRRREKCPPPPDATLFHTEVVVCPRAAFANDAAFLNLLDGKLTALKPSRFATATGVGADGTAATEPFAPIARDRWSTQAAPGCVQLGYGGANCGGGCCAIRRNNMWYYKTKIDNNIYTDR